MERNCQIVMSCIAAALTNSIAPQLDLHLVCNHLGFAESHAAKANIHWPLARRKELLQVLWRLVVHALGSLQLAEAHHLSVCRPVQGTRQQCRAPAVRYRDVAVVLH